MALLRAASRISMSSSLLSASRCRTRTPSVLALCEGAPGGLRPAGVGDSRNRAATHLLLSSFAVTAIVRAVVVVAAEPRRASKSQRRGEVPFIFRDSGARKGSVFRRRSQSSPCAIALFFVNEHWHRANVRNELAAGLLRAACCARSPRAARSPWPSPPSSSRARRPPP